MRDAAAIVSGGLPAQDTGRPTRREALFAALAAEPWKWSYFQALRLLECLAPELPRLGQASRPADEIVRLGQQPSLSFAPASLAGLIEGQAGAPPRIEVSFLGLFGPNGPLPLHLTEYARNRLLHAGDASFVRFADLIHHRFLSLFYRAWAQAQPCVSLDRPGQDRFGRYVGSLCGLGLDSLRERDAMPDHAKLHHAGLLGRQVRNAEGLATMLSGFLGLPAAVEQFVGHWMTLRERDRTSLGRLDSGCGGLGRDAVLGGRVWDRQHKFRLRIGPLSLADYQSLLPGAGGIEALVDAVRNYAGIEHEWDVCLLLRADCVPRLLLDGGARLGYSSWLGPRRSDRPADELVLDAPQRTGLGRGAAGCTKPPGDQAVQGGSNGCMVG